MAFLACAALSLLTAGPAQAATLDRSAATRKALDALGADRGRAALTVFALRTVVPAGAQVTQAGPAQSTTAMRPLSSARPAAAGVQSLAAPKVLQAGEPSWLFYADAGPNQAFEHPGRVVLVGARSGTVRMSRTLRWVPLLDGRLPAFFASAAAYESSSFRVFDRPWSSAANAARATARAAASTDGEAAMGRLADALATERSCALRVSDTLGDFYDFGRVDRTRAGLGRFFAELAQRNPGFVTERYTTHAGLTPVQTAQDLVDGGCRDLFLYVAGGAMHSGPAGVVVGIRAAGGDRVEWHTVGTRELQDLIRANRGVTFKLLFDAPYAGRIARALRDEPNVSVLMTAGTADEGSFTYLPQIVGNQGTVTNPSNPGHLLEFTNTVLTGLGRFGHSPAEVDSAIAQQAAGRTPSVLAWMLARSLNLGPAPFTSPLQPPPPQRLPFTVDPPAVTPPVAPEPTLVNRAPSATTPDQATDEDAPLAFTLAGSDPDGDPLTYTIASGPQHGTLTGAAPAMTYTPARDFAGADAFTYRVDDGRGGSATATVAIAVKAINDAPTLTLSPGAAPDFTEGGSAVVVDAGLTVTDPDSALLDHATATIVGRRSGDVLAVGQAHGLTVAYDAPSGVLTLTGGASPSTYEAALRTITFANTGVNPGSGRIVRFRVADGSDESPPAERAVAVTAIDDPPVLDAGTSSALAYTEDDAATAVVPALTASDADSPQATGAVVRIASGLVAGQDRLAFPGATGITADPYDSATGTLTLHGPASIGAYEAALRTVTYVNTSQAPATAARTVELQLDDGTSLSAAVSRTVAVTAVNDAPVNTLPAAETVDEDTPLTVSGLGVSDPDVGAAQLRATLTASHGRIALTGTAGLTFIVGSGSGDTTMTFDGSAAAMNAAIDGLVYTPESDYSGPDSLTLTTSDGGSTGTGGTQTDTDTLGITVAAVNDAPVLTLPAGQTVTEDVAKTFSAAGGDAISLQDADAGTTDLKVALAVGHGTLTPATTSGLTSSSGSATGTLSLTGPRTALLAALDGLTYTPAADAAGLEVLTVQVDDLGHTGSGGARTDAGTVDLTISAVNDAPQAHVPAAQSVLENGTLAFSSGGGNALSVSDVDAGAADVEVGLHAGHGLLTLSGTAGLTFTAGDGTADATLTFRGSLTDIGAALNGATYSPDAGYAGADALDVSVDDLGHTGSGGAKTDATSVTVDVTSINHAPVNGVPSAQTVAEDATKTFSSAAGNAITVADSDAGSADLEVVLGVTHGTLTLGSVSGLTSASGNGTGAVTLRGTIASLASALDGLAYAPATNYNGADALTVATDDLGHTGVGGAKTDSDTVDLTVTAVDDAPVIAVPATQTVAEDGTLTLSSGAGSAPTVSDVDAGGDDLQLTLSATHGSYTVAGGGSPATITGTLAQINGALDGLTFTPAADYTGAAAVQLSVSDLGHNGAGGPQSASTPVDVTVTAVNDPPVLGKPGGQTVDEDTALTFSAGNANAITATDVDATQLEVALAVAHGTLTLGSTTGLVTTAGADGGASMTFHGSPANVAAALDGLTYKGTSNYNGPDALSIDVGDLGGTGTGGALHASGTVALSVTAVNDPPTAAADSFGTAIGNTTLAVGVSGAAGPVKEISGSVLTNDTDAEGDPLTASSADPDVTMNADGTFTYLPPAGVEGSDTFTYSVSDGTGSTTGTVTVSIGQDVWYVKSDAAGGGDGRSTKPYTSLSQLNGAGGTGDVDGTNDIIFLYGDGTDYAGGLPLESGQELTGQPQGLTVSGTALVPAAGATSPVVSNASGAGVTLADNAVVRRVSAAGTTAGFAAAGVGSADIGSGLTAAASSPGGFALDLNGGGGTVTFAGSALTGSSGAGAARIRNRTSGTVATAPSTALAGSSIVLSGNTSGTATTFPGPVSLSASGGATALDIAGPGSVSLTDAGSTIDSASGTAVAIGTAAGGQDIAIAADVRTATGRPVSVQGRTGGTVTFAGPVHDTGTSLGILVQNNSGGATVFSNPTKELDTGGATGVRLASNTGHAVRFTGGSLDVATTSGRAFYATGGGTVEISGAGNTLSSSSGGGALELTDTTISANGLTFQRLDSAGAASGIILNNTGASGGTTVTGTGSAGSGGTISGSSGPGIVLADTRDVALTRMVVSGGFDDGIRATTVDGLALTSSSITGNGDDVGEHGLDYTGVTGTSTISATTVSGSAELNARIANTAGMLHLTVPGSTFSNTSPTIGGSGLLLYGDGNATMNATVTGSTFSANRDAGLQLATNGTTTATMNLTFTGNHVLGGNAGAASGQPGVAITPGGSSHTTVLLDNNDIAGSLGAALILNAATSSTSAATFDATADHTAIGTSTAGSGSAQAQGIAVKLSGNGTNKVSLGTNTIQHYGDMGILVRTGNGSGSGAAHVTATGNTISNGEAATKQEAIFVQSGTTTGDDRPLCVDLGSNTFAGQGGNAAMDLGVWQRFATAITFPGLSGGAGGLPAYVQSRNPGSPSVGTTGASISGGAACATPATPAP